MKRSNVRAELSDVQSIDEQPVPAAQGRMPDQRRSLAMNTIVGGVSSFGKIAIQLLLLPVMARLLGPSEFGLYALALPTIAFFTVLADGGLGVSLAREDESSSHVWATAFWVMLATGFVLSLVVSGWGLILADLTQAPRLPRLMYVLSASFVFIGLSVLPTARLTRRGELVLYAVFDFVAVLIGAVVAILMALDNAGAMSLAVQYLTTYLIRAVLLNAVAFRRPTGAFDLGSLRGHLLTGGFLLTGRLIEFSSRLLENLLVGRNFGTAALGTYTFANQVPRYVCEAASNPTWSALYAHALRALPQDLGPTYRNMCRFLAVLTFPAAALLSASAPQLLEIIVGPKWAAAAPLIQILVPSYAIGVVASQGTAIMLASGRNQVFLAVQTWLCAGRVLAVCSGPWLGLSGIAWGIVATNLVYALAVFVTAGRLTGSTTGDILRALRTPTLASVGAGFACLFALDVGPTGLVGLALGLAAGVVGFFLIMTAIGGPEMKADLMRLRRIIGLAKDA